MKQYNKLIEIISNGKWVFGGIGVVVFGSIWAKYISKRVKPIISTFFVVFLFSILLLVFARTHPEIGFWEITTISLYIFIILVSTNSADKLFCFLSERGIADFCKDKAREFHYLLLPSQKKDLVLPIPEKFNCFELHSRYKEIVCLLKDVICFNQGFYANYAFEGGRLHKRIKDYMRGGNIDKHKLASMCKELRETLQQGLMDAIGKNHDYLYHYFNGRSEFPPRIIIKAYQGGNMVDVFRKNYEYYSEYPKEENSGFLHVYNKGTYFICNDIPKNVIEGKYENPRIVVDRVKTYWEAFKANNRVDLEHLWIQCWLLNYYAEDKKKKLPSRESCYKSTLIIPMTLINNEGLSVNFRKHFEIPDPGTREEDFGRAVYAFLCIDHRDTHYFNKNIDVEIGYIFADLLSLYFIERLNYTTYSTTFRKALEILNDSN